MRTSWSSVTALLAVTATRCAADLFTIPSLNLAECGDYVDNTGSLGSLLRYTGADSLVDNTELSCVGLAGDPQCQSILQSAEWIKFAVIREPVEMITWGFLDRCMRATGRLNLCELHRFASVYGPNNNADAIELNDTPVRLKAEDQIRIELARRKVILFNEYMLSTIASLNDPTTSCNINRFFNPQVCDCGLSNPDIKSQVILLAAEKLTPQYLQKKVVKALQDGGRSDEAIAKFVAAYTEAFSKSSLQLASKATINDLTNAHLRAAVKVAYAPDYALLAKTT